MMIFVTKREMEAEDASIRDEAGEGGRGRVFVDDNDDGSSSSSTTTTTDYARRFDPSRDRMRMIRNGPTIGARLVFTKKKVKKN